jgi:hypothetical protein
MIICPMLLRELVEKIVACSPPPEFTSLSWKKERRNEFQILHIYSPALLEGNHCLRVNSSLVFTENSLELGKMKGPQRTTLVA